LRFLSLTAFRFYYDIRDAIPAVTFPAIKTEVWRSFRETPVEDPAEFGGAVMEPASSYITLANYPKDT
jgi:hypothetical protein